MKKFKFWNPDMVDDYQPGINGYDCTAAELSAAEEINNGSTSTELLLVDAQAADDIMRLILNETNVDMRYEEIKGDL